METPKFYKAHTPYGDVVEADYTAEVEAMACSLQRNGTYMPAVKRVVTNVKTEEAVDVLDKNGKPVVENGNNKKEWRKLEKPLHTTIVEFYDGSKTIVKCSSADAPNTETAIVNAIVKRLYGTVDKKTGLVDGTGVGAYLRKLVKNAWDQPSENEKIRESKLKNKEANIARQKQQQVDAHARKIEKLAKEVQNYLEAFRKLGLEVAATTTSKPNMLSESNKTCSCCSEDSSCECGGCNNEYVRPNKPFSQFTQTEKREYWKAQKAGKLSK